MKNSDVIYNGIIKDINFKLCRNYTPYIEILVETLDVNKALISSCYYFTDKSKYLSYNELSNLLEYFDIKGFGADFAYTVDGGELGDMSYECFNAASGRVTVKGKSVHPGYAKGIMKNAIKSNKEYYSIYHSDCYNNSVRKSFLKDCIKQYTYILNNPNKEIKSFMRFIKEYKDSVLNKPIYTKNNSLYIQYFINDVFNICLFDDI